MTLRELLSKRKWMKVPSVCREGRYFFFRSNGTIRQWITYDYYHSCWTMQTAYSCFRDGEYVQPHLCRITRPSTIRTFKAMQGRLEDLGHRWNSNGNRGSTPLPAKPRLF